MNRLNQKRQLLELKQELLQEKLNNIMIREEQKNLNKGRVRKLVLVKKS